MQSHCTYCYAQQGEFGAKAKSMEERQAIKAVDLLLSACHHEVMARGRGACDYIRGWLHYTIGAHQRLSQLAPGWFATPSGSPD